VVTDAHVGPLYAQSIVAGLQGHAARIEEILVQPGEGSKSVAGVSGIWDAMVAAGVSLGDLVVALGGGVVGDLAGFAAATILRGIRWVQVPTTVLAMCDAAIGGKTGINLTRGKNLVGAFYPPAAVLTWIGYAASLSDREVRSGLAEAVKSALIASEDAFAALESDVDALTARNPAALLRAVEMAASVKVAVVSKDPDERGLRRVLNLGHTLGHALEHATGYGALTHGECVSVGLVMALSFSAAQGWTDAGLADRVAALLQRLGLPTAPPRMPVAAWWDPLQLDKKLESDAVRFVVCRKPGDVFDVRLPLVQIRDWLARQPYVELASGAQRTVE
jgi:3-dehydroquinate synthase